MSMTENDVVKNSVVDMSPVEIEIETPCLICGEGIPAWLGDYRPKVCNGCREAVMAMRKKMED